MSKKTSIEIFRVTERLPSSSNFVFVWIVDDEAWGLAAYYADKAVCADEDGKPIEDGVTQWFDQPEV